MTHSYIPNLGYRLFRDEFFFYIEDLRKERLCYT
nr:MAG TPA: hypothetical protein [Caudoviricetes sp.]